jgi:hypothetical protein
VKGDRNSKEWSKGKAKKEEERQERTKSHASGASAPVASQTTHSSGASTSGYRGRFEYSSEGTASQREVLIEQSQTKPFSRRLESHEKKQSERA